MTLVDAFVIGKQLGTALMESHKLGRTLHEPVTSSPLSVKHTETAEAAVRVRQFRCAESGQGAQGEWAQEL